MPVDDSAGQVDTTATAGLDLAVTNIGRTDGNGTSLTALAADVSLLGDPFELEP